MESVNVAIIGGGAVGLAVAWRVAKLHKGSVCLFEKNDRLGLEQSSHNSGVIHAGIYSSGLTQELCKDGNKLLYDFASTYGVPARNTGKLIVALNEMDRQTLETLATQDDGIEKSLIEDACELEPNIRCQRALYIPSTGIIDAASYIEKLKQLCKDDGVSLLTRSPVERIHATPSGYTLHIGDPQEKYTVHAQFLINSAGLYAHTLAGQILPELAYTPLALKGEFLKFRMDSASTKIQRVIYPAPRQTMQDDIPIIDLGIHLTPTFTPQEVIVGPAFMNAKSLSDYSCKDIPHAHFSAAIQRYFPNLDPSKLTPAHAGILVASATGSENFIIDSSLPQAINLLNIGSPGLSASLALAEYVARIVGERV